MTNRPVGWVVAVYYQMVDGEIAAGVPLDKIVLGGFSQGGAVVYYTALRGKKKFAGESEMPMNGGWMSPMPYDL